MATGTRLEAIRGLETFAKEDFVLALFTLALADANPSSIEPDDVAVIGSSTQYAREDHQHAIVAAAAADLTETLTSSEGSASSFARSDHVHATGAVAWGLLGVTQSTSSSSSTSGTTELDLALDVTATATSGRRVMAVFGCRNVLGTTQQDLFEIRIKESGTQVYASRGQVHEVTAHADGLQTVSYIYTPTAGSRTWEAFLVRVGGTGTASVQAAASSPMYLAVVDVG